MDIIITREPSNITRPPQRRIIQGNIVQLLHEMIGGRDNEGTNIAELLRHILMNERSSAGAPPASPQVIERLPRHLVTEDCDLSTLGECAISMESFQVGDTIVELPCRHKYRESHITQWLQMNSTCPVCRRIIDESTIPLEHS